MKDTSVQKLYRKIRRKFERLGPGFITGAADDDPSGIATYSIAGAQFGYKLTWLSVFLTPLMISVQEMCGRIGMVSGSGLAGAIRKHYSRDVLFLSVSLLFIANTINIGANLGAMAASLQMVVGFHFFFWLIVMTLLTIGMEIFIPYDRYSKYLKWMGLSLVVYGITALITKQDWLSVMFHAFIPHIEWNSLYFTTMVGFLGTTISPYLFFWQASEEVEEAIRDGKIQEFEESPTVIKEEISHMQKDTAAGMFFSNLVAFFIILTATSTLHANGITDIESPQEAALALAPLAGNFSYILFTLGIIGIGLQSVPILAGSAAYAISESFGFKEGLAKKLTEAKAFYATIAISTLLGALMNIIGINAIKALYYAAIVNALSAIPLLIIIIKLADDHRVVGHFRSTSWGKRLAWTTVCLMTVASVIMIANLVRENG